MTRRWIISGLMLAALALGVTIDLGANAKNGVDKTQRALARTQAALRITELDQQRSLHAGCIGTTERTVAQVGLIDYPIYDADVTRSHQGTAAQQSNSATESNRILTGLRHVVLQRFDVAYARQLPAKLARYVLQHTHFTCPPA